jgi:pilus assembly protein CpaE
MLVHHPHLVHESNIVVLVTEFTLASARDSIRILSWLKSNAPQSQVIVAANKALPGVLEIARKDFEHSIERKIDIVLPYDAKVTTQAAKLGKTVAESGRASKLGQELLALSKRLTTTASATGPSAGDEAAKKSGGSLIGRLFDVKLPSPRKAKAKADDELVTD